METASPQWRQLAMAALPIKGNAGSFEYHARWLPGMAIVKLVVTWEFKEILDAEALEETSRQIDMFARYAVECCLREIAECSVQRKVLPGGDSKRSPMRMGMGNNATVQMTLHVAGVSMQDVLDVGVDLVFDVDHIETLIRDRCMWELIHS